MKWMKTVLTLSLNPAIDVEWQVDHVLWEEKNSILSERRWAGGKGVNVARWLRFLGGSPLVLIPMGGPTGQELARELRKNGIRFQRVSIRQHNRVDIIITTPDSKQLRFNPAGPKLDPNEWLALEEQLKSQFQPGRLMVLSGSLPGGASANLYADWIRLGHSHHVKTFLDCDGAVLKAAVEAGPFLIKPNEHELSRWTGQKLATDTSIRQAAKAMSEKTGNWVFVSRGEKGGMLVNAVQNIVCIARAPSIKPVNKNGAGDALLAAVVRQTIDNAPPAEWLRWGLAVGSAATLCQADNLPSTDMVNSLATQIEVKTKQLS